MWEWEAQGKRRRKGGGAGGCRWSRSRMRSRWGAPAGAGVLSDSLRPVLGCPTLRERNVCGAPREVRVRAGNTVALRHGHVVRLRFLSFLTILPCSRRLATHSSRLEIRCCMSNVLSRVVRVVIGGRTGAGGRPPQIVRNRGTFVCPRRASSGVRWYGCPVQGRAPGKRWCNGVRVWRGGARASLRRRKAMFRQEQETTSCGYVC